MNKQETPNRVASSGGSGGITKEMWTVLLDRPEGWQPSDVFCDTKEQAESQLANLRELDAKYQPESTQLNGAVVTRCIVSIYPPNANLSGASDASAPRSG